MGGCLQFGRGGESWDGEEEGKIGEERVGRVVIYSLLSRGITDGLIISMIL